MSNLFCTLLAFVYFAVLLVTLISLVVMVIIDVKEHIEFKKEIAILEELEWNSAPKETEGTR